MGVVGAEARYLAMFILRYSSRESAVSYNIFKIVQIIESLVQIVILIVGINAVQRFDDVFVVIFHKMAGEIPVQKLSYVVFQFGSVHLVGLLRGKSAKIDMVYNINNIVN